MTAQRVSDDELAAIIELEIAHRRRGLGSYRPTRDYLMAQELVDSRAENARLREAAQYVVDMIRLGVPADHLRTVDAQAMVVLMEALGGNDA